MTLPDFLKTPEALDFWVEREVGVYSRGIPGKLPYEVCPSPLIKTDSKSDRYWQHYGYKGRAAPIRGRDAFEQAPLPS